MTISHISTFRRWTFVLAAIATLMLGGCGDSVDDLVASARKEMDQKQYRAAILHLRNALQKDANNGAARYELGVALRQSHDLVSAEKELRRALELGHDPAKVQYELAHVVYGLRKYDELVREFGGVQLSSPQEQAQIKALIGNALYANGKLEEAAASLVEALRIDPSNVSAQVGQARVLITRGDRAGAQGILSSVLDKAPMDREALLAQASLHQIEGKEERAIEVLRKFLEYYPESIAERYSLVSLQLDLRKIDDAKAGVSEMEKTAPKDPRTLHAKAMLAFRQGDFTSAQQDAVRALSAAPDFTPAQMTAGAASLNLRSFQQAIQYLTAVLQKQKHNGLAHQMLITAYLGADDVHRAERALKDARELFPSDSRLLLLAGEVAARGRKLNDASKYFDLSADKGDPTGLAALRLGQVLLAEGKEEEGLKVLEQVSKSGDRKIQSDVALVVHHLRRGQLDSAQKWIESIEKKSPGSALAPALRGVMLASKRELLSARQQFDLALQRDGTSPIALNYLTRLDLADKQFAKAKLRYAEAIKLDPKNERLVIDYARVLRSIGEKPEAVVEPLTRFIQDNPSAERARLALVETTLRSDRNKAVEIARDAVSALPESGPVKLALGRALQLSGDHNQALSTYAEVIKLRPRDISALVATAQIHAELGNQAKAIDAVDRALEIAPENLELQRGKIVLLMNAKQPDRALKVAQEVKRKQPRKAVGYELESAVLVGMNRWDQAVEVLTEGQRQAPSSQMVIRLHTALMEADKKDRATRVASDWLAQHTKDVPVRAYLASRAMAIGDHESAARMYKEALVASPRNPALLNNLAWVADKINDPKALSYAEDANRLAPDTPQILDTLGVLLVKRGEVNRGVDLLEKAAKAAPQALSVRLNYARALVQAGRKAEARKELDFLRAQGDRFKGRSEVDALYGQL